MPLEPTSPVRYKYWVHSRSIVWYNQIWLYLTHHLIKTKTKDQLSWLLFVLSQWTEPYLSFNNLLFWFFVLFCFIRRKIAAPAVLHVHTPPGMINILTAVNRFRVLTKRLPQSYDAEQDQTYAYVQSSKGLQCHNALVFLLITQWFKETLWSLGNEQVSLHRLTQKSWSRCRPEAVNYPMHV